MKIILATLGGFALQLLLMAVTIIVVALALWLLVPAAFPALGFGFLNAIGLAGVLYIVKAVFA